jgi:hypothetical protein
MFGVFTVRFGKAPCLSGFPTKEHNLQSGNIISDISVHIHGMLQFLFSIGSTALVGPGRLSVS